MPVKKQISRSVSTDIDRYGAHNGNEPDLIEDLNLTKDEFDKLEKDALKTWSGIGKRKRGPSDQAQKEPRKRRAIKENDIVASSQASYGSDPFQGLSPSKLDVLENESSDIARGRYHDKDSYASDENDLHVPGRGTPHYWPGPRGGNDIQPGPSLDTTQNANDENEFEFVALDKAVQPEFNVNIAASRPSEGIRQVRQDVRVKKPPQRVNRLQSVPKTGTKATDTWPPHHDLGVYSHDFKVTRENYKRGLQALSLSGDLAYEINNNVYDQGPSPDRIPFAASKEDVLFNTEFKVLLPSEACVLVGKDSDRPLYYSVDKFHFSKITPAERNLLGFNDTFVEMTNIATARLSDVFKNNFSKLGSDEKDDLIERRGKRITEKFAKIEFVYQKKNTHKRKGRPSTFFDQDFSKLSDDDKEHLLNENAERNRENAALFPGSEYYRRNVALIDSRGSNDEKLLAASVLEELGLNDRLVENARPGWPLLLDASNNKEIFADGRASRPATGSRCLLVSTQNFPTYYLLNTHQERQFSMQDLIHLGFVPHWAQTLSPTERYQFGLLPPGSEALRDALKHDANFAQYLGNLRAQAASHRDTNLTNRQGIGATGRNAPIVSKPTAPAIGRPKTGQNAELNSRDRTVERSKSSGR